MCKTSSKVFFGYVLFQAKIDMIFYIGCIVELKCYSFLREYNQKILF